MMDSRKTSYKVKYPIKYVFVFHVSELNVLYAGIMSGLNNLKQGLDNWPEAKSGLEYRPELYNKVLNSLRQNAIVAIFHCWMRNLEEFFAMGGDSINDNKHVILKKGHEFILGLFAKDKALQDIISVLKKYGCLTNAIKHGFGDSFDKLKCEYSEFFNVPDEYMEFVTVEGDTYEIIDTDAPFVLQSHIDELYNATLDFWSNVPDKLVLDFTRNKNNNDICPRRMPTE